MKRTWVVTKVVSPLGYSFMTYLSIPRFNGIEAWDEEHDAQLFTFWEACWQGLRHLAWPARANLELYTNASKDC
jgi:hypothetical protein